MKKYSSIEEIQEYFERPDIDQSKLKRLILGLDALMDERESKLYFEEKESLIIGSVVDCLMTNQEGDFEKRYHISTLVSKPSDSIKSVVNQVYDYSRISMEDSLEAWKKLPLAYHNSLIVAAIEQQGYQNNWKMDTRVNKILEQSDYFDDLKEATGKQVLSLEEYSLAQQIVDSLGNLGIIKLCKEADSKASEDYEVYYQYPIYFTYQGEACKGLIDILVVDRKSGKYYIIDVKTTFGRTLDFFSSVMKYRYDIQLAFYREAVSIAFGVPFDKIGCLFAVESTSRLGTPLVYNCSQSLLNQGAYGRKAVVVDGVTIKKEIKGYSQLMELYSYYMQTGFNQEKVIAEAKNPNYLTLDINGIMEE